MKKWFFDADYLQACNCDYGCPCEFAAPPTPGFCHGIGVWKIQRGKYDELSLDGLGLAFAATWPTRRRFPNRAGANQKSSHGG